MFQAARGTLRRRYRLPCLRRALQVVLKDADLATYTSAAQVIRIAITPARLAQKPRRGG